MRTCGRQRDRPGWKRFGCEGGTLEAGRGVLRYKPAAAAGQDEFQTAHNTKGPTNDS